jgi:hypothetical protein
VSVYYTTQPGWAHNDSTFEWELHDHRNQVRGTITDEACRPFWDYLLAVVDPWPSEPEYPPKPADPEARVWQ